MVDIGKKCSVHWEPESWEPWPLFDPLLPQDLQLFREAGGWDVVSAVAEFWCSRVEWSPAEEKYHLTGEDMAGSGWLCGGVEGHGGG